MNPNTIEIDQQGVFCYQTPDIASVPHLTDKAIKVSKYDRVYFKDPIPVISAFVKTNGLLVEGSQYHIPDGYTIEVSPDDEFCWRAGTEYPLYAKLVKINNMENPDNLKWKSDEPEKKSFIDKIKLYDMIMKDPLIKELNKRKEECLKVAIPVMLKFDNEFKMSIQYESINEVYLRNIDRMINDRYEYFKELYKDL